jgi:hypothetical protein
MNMEAIAAQAREYFARVASWDMCGVNNYLTEKDGLESSYIERMELEYKRFIGLTLAVGQGITLPVSTEIDPMWHTHIIFTQDYTRMCHDVAEGVYVHHLPAVSQEERERLCDAYNNGTLPLYRLAFGEPDPTFWPPNAQICIACCDRPGPSTDPQTIRRLVI